jgi:exosortase
MLFAVFGALWSMLIADLFPHWAANPQYSFGWFVPVICAYLFLICWRTRPPVELAKGTVGRWVFWMAGFALPPTWLVEQANPDWRLLSWLLASEIVALSLCTIYFTGGRSWLRHFAFSICFILVSVPWLAAVEDFVIQGLTQAVTAITVAFLNLFHISAVQHGNVIQMQTAFVGVDEACSGIRSLQAALMVSLFLGELYRVSKFRRAILFLCGPLIALLCNLGRAFLLAVVAAKAGVEAISNWHDPLGYIILAICFVLILGLVRLFAGPLPKMPPAKPTEPIPFPGRLLFGLTALVMFTVIGTEIWYRRHEARETLDWSVTWPISKEDFSDISISKLEADVLACDEKRAAEWTNGDGSHWMAFFFRWAEGPRWSRIRARMHRPENCLPAAGYRLRENRGAITIQTKNGPITFRALDFEYAGDRVNVFFCLWEEGLKPSEPLRIQDDWNLSARFESVLLGERNLGQQVLEIVISGCDTPEHAEAAFRREIGAMIRT